jgi:dTDP-4-dehydrorhamnose 3,5-epimerase
MHFTELELAGAYLIDIEPHTDERGFFARSWCARELLQHGLDATVEQESISYNKRRGTVRGMHYQIAPFEERKKVRCTSGAIYDVIVDLREGSPTRGKWSATELSAVNRRTLYIPAGFAHGFQTLADDTEVLYQMSIEHAPEAARGIRWDDERLGISWPIRQGITVSSRDAGLPDL